MAGAFLGAFLRYETGRVSIAVTRALRATATAALAAALQRRPARLPLGRPTPRVAAVGRVSAHGPWHGRLKVTATLRRHQVRDRLELDLRRSSVGWRVASLR